MATKEQVLFWLNRRLRDLESVSTPPTHEEMAKAGVPYEARQGTLERAEANRDKNAGEIDALQTAMRLVEQHG